jgi:trk system potassium uptake protein TrkH
MSFRRLGFIVAAVAEATGAAMMSAAIVAGIYGEWSDAWAIALASAAVVVVFDLVRRLIPPRQEMTTREGFAAVALAWIAMAFIGTLPYLVTGSVSGLTDAFFETAAGFTTTGSSIVPDPAQLGHGVLWWRALTQWMGGMGIIVLSIAILPLLGTGGVQLARAESPGPTPDRLTPRFRETAKRLWFVYFALTMAEAVLLSFTDMTVFDAITHSFTTMSTGGFGTKATSMAAFDSTAQWIVIAFMVLAGVSFALHYKALRFRDPLAYLRHAEFRLYGMILVAATAFIVIGTWGGQVADTIRDGVFTSVSLVTTTGYATADFGQWASSLQVLVVGLMFVGGMAGSTGGSVKVYRLGVLYQGSKADLRRLIHPRGVFVTKLGRDPVPDPIAESVQSFFLLYMFIFMTATLAFTVFESIAGANLDLVTSASAVASALGNIGPGLGEVGPAANFAVVPAAGKWLLSFIMIVGRLEVFPVILLLTRELWRR